MQLQIAIFRHQIETRTKYTILDFFHFNICICWLLSSFAWFGHANYKKKFFCIAVSGIFIMHFVSFKSSTKFT